jgi:hypothetical protein
LTEHETVDFLMRVHYNFFMVNPRFWYERSTIDADALICIAASNLRCAIKKKEAVDG